MNSNRGGSTNFKRQLCRPTHRAASPPYIRKPQRAGTRPVVPPWFSTHGASSPELGQLREGPCLCQVPNRVPAYNLTMPLAKQRFAARRDGLGNAGSDPPQDAQPIFLGRSGGHGRHCDPHLEGGVEDDLGLGARLITHSGPSPGEQLMGAGACDAVHGFFGRRYRIPLFASPQEWFYHLSDRASRP
jgi:hypothetical protein